MPQADASLAPLMPLFVSAPMRNPHCRSGHQQQATAPNFVDQLVEAWRCIQRLSQCGECADSCTAMARVVQQAVKCDNSCLQGLLHFDGIDSMGRPIIIVNARAAAASDISLRPLAVKYMMQRLDPIVYAVRTYSRPTSPQASGMQMGFLSAAQVFRRVSNMTVIAPRAYTDMQFKASQVTRTCVRCQIFLCHESCFSAWLQGPYVLVLVAMGASGFGPEDERRSRLPAMWLIKCYSRLTRPYKKNVSLLSFLLVAHTALALLLHNK